MHPLQPMQLSSLKSTTPLSARNSALVGQIEMQGASSHWLQRITEKMTAGVREGAGLYVFHPGSVYPEGNIVLTLAGHGAGVAADTRVAV